MKKILVEVVGKYVARLQKKAKYVINAFYEAFYS
jgi:hypothetical protein